MNRILLNRWSKARLAIDRLASGMHGECAVSMDIGHLDFYSLRGVSDLDSTVDESIVVCCDRDETSSWQSLKMRKQNARSKNHSPGP